MTARKPSRKGSRKTAAAEANAKAPAEAVSVEAAQAPAPTPVAAPAASVPVSATTTAEAAPAPAPAKRARTKRADAVPPRPRQGGDGGGARPSPALDGADRGRLLAGDHHAPHSVLGAHLIPGGVLVRALRPFARSVTVLAEGCGPNCTTTATGSSPGCCR